MDKIRLVVAFSLGLRHRIFSAFVRDKCCFQGTPVAQWTAEEKSYYSLHLLNSVGHYNNLLMFIESSGGAGVADVDFARAPMFDLDGGSGEKTFLGSIHLSQTSYKSLLGQQL